GKLEASVRFMDAHPDVDILYGDIVLIDENGDEISRENMRRHSGRISGLLLHDNFISNNTVMVRRECFEQLGGFNEKDRLAEDYELWLRMSTRYTFHYLPEYMAAYRVMDDQISSDKDKRFWANERILLKFLETYPDAVTPGERRRGLSKFYTRKGRYELSVKRRRDALKDGWRALASDPFWQGPWRLLAKILLAR
ncbi:MAG: glycosyl transferase, partial [Gammaproteobacteria bacterium]|nr:glycosyl transferase [Gammaproteobacteria bacterium]